MASYEGELQGPGGDEPAQLHLDQRGLRVLGERGTLRRVPYREVLVDITADHALYLRSQKGDLALRTLALDLLEELERRGATIEPQVKAQLHTRGEKRRSTRWFVSLLGSVALIPLLLVLLPKVALLFIDWAPKSIDQRLGASVWSEIHLGEALEDPRISQPLQQILDRLTPYAGAEDYQLELHVFDHPMVNAFALPGGRMIVTTGLLDCAETGEEVAAVLAHELAHVTRRHSVRTFVRGSGVLAVAKLLGNSDSVVVGTAAQGAALTMMLRHQREYESEADQDALTTLAAAQLDGLALRSILLRMEGQSGGQASTPEWAQTHPDTTHRAEAIEAAVAGLGPVPTQPLRIDWLGLKDALPRHPGRPGMEAIGR